MQSVTPENFDLIEEEENRKSKDALPAGCLKGEEFSEVARPIHRLFEEMMDKNLSQDLIALTFIDKGISRRVTKYSELNKTANQMANLFIDSVRMHKSACRANSDGDFIIAVIANPSDTLITIFLAILKSGAAYLPIDPRFPRIRVEHILNESRPVLVLFEDNYRYEASLDIHHNMKIGDIFRELTTMSSENTASDDKKLFTTEGIDKKALICYTSGTTGAAKGVRLSHRTLFQRIHWQLLTFPFTVTETHCVFKTPASFIDHVGELWCPLMGSKTLVVVPRDNVANVEKFVTILEKYKVQRLVLFPSLLRSILTVLKGMIAGPSTSKRESASSKRGSTWSKRSTVSSKRESISSKRGSADVNNLLANLRLWISSGDVLSKNLVEEFFDHFSGSDVVLMNCYGSTEALDCVIYEIQSKYQVEKLEKIPLGVPTHNTMIYVLDNDTSEPMEEGETGEICVSGLSLARGYVSGRPQYAFTTNPLKSGDNYKQLYHTGDYGFIRNGLLYFEGREDSQVKVDGHKVDPEEVNAVVIRVEYVHECVTYAYHPRLPDQAIVTFLAMRRYYDKAVVKEPEAIVSDLRTILIDYMVPKVHIVTRIPRISTGKIDKQDLLQQYEESLPKEQVKIHVDYDLKSIPLERRRVAKKVFQTIGVALGGDFQAKLSADSNFYRLGGSSLNTISTVYELKEKGCHISVDEFIKAKNIGEIIKQVSDKKKDTMKFKIDTKFICEPFNLMERGECIDVLSNGYAAKSTLDKYIPGIKAEHYRELLDWHWDNYFMKQGISFMVKNTDDEVIGVTLLTNLAERLCEFPNNPVKYIFDFIANIERPIIANRITGSCVHVFMMGTSHKLHPRTNVALIDFMETKAIETAREHKYNGILTTNTNPLNYTLGIDVYGYEIMVQYQINKYVDKDGKKPFVNAPDEQVVAVVYKNLKIK